MGGERERASVSFSEIGFPSKSTSLTTESQYHRQDVLITNRTNSCSCYDSRCSSQKDIGIIPVFHSALYAVFFLDLQKLISLFPREEYC